jgi:hypothetical protein
LIFHCATGFDRRMPARQQRLDLDDTTDS